MDWDTVVKNYSTDYHTFCDLAYHFLTSTIAGSKRLNKHDKEILMGMLPGGNYTVFMERYGEWYDLAYQSDYFGHVRPIGTCNKLGWTDLNMLNLSRAQTKATLPKFNIKPGMGEELIYLTLNPPKVFDKFIKTQKGQDLIKAFTWSMIDFAVWHAIEDIALLVVIAVFIGLINGFVKWLESLNLPSWLLNPLLSLLGVGKNALERQFNLTENDIREIANAVANDNKMLLQVFNTGMSMLNNSLDSIETSVSNIVDNTLNKITPVIENVKDYITGKITNAINTVKENITKVINPLVKKVTNGNKAIEDRLDKMVNGSLRLNLTEMFGS